jgi:electron transfer flavoprotein beta subunit
LNIVVCVKEVPNPALPVEFDVVNNTIKDQQWNYVMNPYDEASLEEALRLKEKQGGTVTVISLGSPRIEGMLRKCLALGSDQAIRLDSPDNPFPDAYCTAAALASAISRRSYDLVFCGSRSIDRNGGEVGCMLAELLHLPLVTGVVKLEMAADLKSLVVQCRLERGAREVKRCPLPALVTADIRLNEPRYPTLPGIQKAESQSIAVEASGLDPEQALTRMTGLSRPPPKKVFIPTGNLTAAERIRMLTQGAASKKSSTNLLEGMPAEIATKTVAFLTERQFLP